MNENVKMMISGETQNIRMIFEKLKHTWLMVMSKLR